MEKTIKDLDIYISDGNYSSKYPRSEEFVKEGIPFIRGNNMVDGDISDDEMYYITPEKHAILLKGHVKAGDVLITTRGNIGQVAIVPERHEDSNINAQIVLLRTNSKSLYNRYLLWALQSHRANEQYIALQTGTALKQLPVGKLEKLSIKVADIDEQHDIANTLDKVYEVIKERRKELLLLDNLIKARFVEMFGDPDINPKGWTECALSEKLNVVGGYAFKSNMFDEDGGIPVLRIGNINAGYFKPVNLVYWQEDEDLERYAMYPGDLVMSLTGTVGKDDYGNVCILGDDYEMYYLNQRNAKLEIKEGIDKFYIAQLLKFEQIKKKLTGISRGVRQANISNKDILNLVVPVPSMELQNQFADFVNQVDKSKVVVKKALEQAQLLFDSLMQEYFG